MHLLVVAKRGLPSALASLLMHTLKTPISKNILFCVVLIFIPNRGVSQQSIA